MVRLTGSKLPLYFTVDVWSLKCTLGRTLNTATPIHNSNLLHEQLTVSQEQALWDFAYLTHSFDLEKKYTSQLPTAILYFISEKYEGNNKFNQVSMTAHALCTYL